MQSLLRLRLHLNGLKTLSRLHYAYNKLLDCDVDITQPPDTHEPPK